MHAILAHVALVPPDYPGGPNPFDPRQTWLWMITGLILVAVVARWLTLPPHRRRAKLDQCPSCGYSRDGLPDRGDRCPECGTLPAPNRG